MELFIYISIAIIIVLFLVYFLPKKPKNIKTKAQKQQEIADEYIQKLQQLQNQQTHDKELYLQEKTKLLIAINKELEFNVFFTKEEKTMIIKKLSQY